MAHSTRAQKRIMNTPKENLNVSYDIVIYDDKPIVSGEKLTTDELLVDLGNKLAASHSLNDQLHQEIIELKATIRSQKAREMYLDEKLNNFLIKKTADMNTQTIPCLPLMNDNNYCQVESQPALFPDTYSQEIIKIVNDLNVQTTQTSEVSRSSFSCPEIPLICESVQVSKESTTTGVVDCFIKSKRHTKGKRLRNNIQPSAPPPTYQPTVNVESKSKVLLISDEMGRGMADALRERLPQRYNVSSFVKSRGSMAYLLQDIEGLAKNFTAADYILLLMSTRQATENSQHYLKRKYRDLINKLDSTNVLIATIPYNFGDFSCNNFIQMINQDLEKTLFAHSHSLCVYTNKILFSEDYDKYSALKATGRDKFASYIAEYIIGSRTDDRSLERSGNPTSANLFEPSKSGTTTSSQKVNSNSLVAKNLRGMHEKKRRKLILLKKLLKLLN